MFLLILQSHWQANTVLKLQHFRGKKYSINPRPSYQYPELILSHKSFSNNNLVTMGLVQVLVAWDERQL